MGVFVSTSRSDPDQFRQQKWAESAISIHQLDSIRHPNIVITSLKAESICT